MSSNSSGIDNLEYTHKSVISTVTIPAGGSITYNVTITNLGNDESVPIAVSNVTFTNGSNQQVSNLSANIDDEHYVKICDNGNCIGPVNQTISVTVTNNGSEPISTNLNTNLTFSKVYSVTYNNEYQGEVLEGHTYEYTFTSDTPSSVTVDSGTCGTPTITNDTLTISNVGSNLVLTGATSVMSGRGTWDDPYIITTSTYDYSNLSAGSYKFTDPTVKGNPEITVDSNGKVIRYELTNYGQDGLVFSNESINSGVLAFDNQKLTIDIVFTAKLGDSSNNYKHILGAIAPGSSANTYSGFTFLNYKGGRMYVNLLNNNTYGSNGLGGSNLISFSLTGNYSNKVNTYTVKIVYDPSQYNDNFNITMTPGSINDTDTITSISNEMKNATVTIGGNGLTNNNMGSITINSLSITKGYNKKGGTYA